MSVRADVVEHVRSVPEVPGVEEDPHGHSDLLEQVDRIREVVDHREVVPRRRVDGLERDAHADLGTGSRNLAKPLDDDLPRLLRIAATDRPGEAEHGGRVECREPPDRGAQRLDPLLRIVRPRKRRQGKDGESGRKADRRLQARLPEAGERLPVLALRQLCLGEADPRCAPRGVGGDVLVEGQRHRAELGDGESWLGHVDDSSRRSGLWLTNGNM